VCGLDLTNGEMYSGTDKGHSVTSHVANRGVEVQLYLITPINARPQPIYLRKVSRYPTYGLREPQRFLGRAWKKNEVSSPTVLRTLNCQPRGESPYRQRFPDLLMAILLQAIEVYRTFLTSKPRRFT